MKLSEDFQVWLENVDALHPEFVNNEQFAEWMDKAAQLEEENATLKRENEAKQDVIDTAFIAHRRCDAKSVPNKIDAVMVWAVAWQEIEDALLADTQESE